MKHKLLLMLALFCLLIPAFAFAGNEDYYTNGWKLASTTDVNGTATFSFNNAPFVAGKIGNGINTYAPSIRAEGTTVCSSASISYEFWFKPNATLTSGSNGTMFDCNNASLTRINRMLVYNTSGTYTFAFRLSGGSTDVRYTLTATQYWNTFNNYGVIFNASNNNATLYFNGQPVNSSIITQVAGSALSGGMAVGNDRSSTATALGGVFDALYKYDYALHPNQMCLLNNATNGAENPMSGLTCSSGPVTTTNASITLYDVYTNTTLTNFTIYENSTIIAQTTNGTAYLPYLTNSSSLYNLLLASNENGGYFNQSKPSQNVSGTMNFALSQSQITFYAVDKVTGATMPGLTIQGQYLTNVTHNFRQNTYSLNTSLTNYYIRSFNYSAVALTNTTQNVSYMFSQKVNVSVTNRVTGAPITSFDITVSNANYSYSETFTGVNSNITLNLSANINYTITISATNYIANSTTFFSSSNWSSTSLTLSANNHILFYFINEDTLLPVYNVNWQVIGENYSQNGTTTNTSNIANVSSLNTDFYELRYWQPVNFTYRSLFFDVPVLNVSGTQINAYMINETLASDFIVTVTDKNNRPVENLVVDLLRRYPINGSTLYYTVEMTKPNLALQGAAPFTAVANIIPYIFRVRRTTDGEVLFQGSGTTSTNLQTVYLIDTNFYIKVNVLSSPFTASRQLRGLTYSLTNTSNTFWLSISDPGNVASQYCLRVVKDRTNVLSNNCTTSAGVIGVGYSPVNGSLYVAQFIATSSQDEKDYVIATLLNDRTSYDSPNWGYTGLFFFILTLITIGIGFSDKPVIGIVMGGASLMLFGLASIGTLVGLPAISGALVSGSLFIVSIIIAVIVNAEDR